jgi:hypothetical protein
VRAEADPTFVRSGTRGRFFGLACALFSVTVAAGAPLVAQAAPAAVEPFPRYDRNSPEGARAVLDWISRATAPAADGSRRCIASNLLVLLGTFPRTEPIDAAFRAYVEHGGVAAAAAVHRLGSFEERLALLASDDACVREFVTPVVISEIAPYAEAEGRVARSKVADAIRAAVSARGNAPHAFDEERPPRLWRDFALVESATDGSVLLHLLRRAGESWEYLGSHRLRSA